MKKNKGMQEMIELVDAFHQAFQIPRNNTPTCLKQSEQWQLRHRLMEEENNEYLEACESQDLTAIADALGDMLYVLFGTVVTHGLQDKMEAILEEIHRSNMSKLDADGNPIFRKDGKILKSDLFFKPELESILKE